MSLVPPPYNPCLSQPCAGAASLVPFNQTNKALRISQAFNGSAYTPYVGPVQYVAAVAQQPANWFSAVAAFVAADPPGEVIGQQHSVPFFCSHVWSPDWCVLQSMTVVRYDRCISLPCSTALCSVGVILLAPLPLLHKLPFNAVCIWHAANGTGTLASQLATLAASANSSNTLLQTAASVATACVTGPFVGVTTQTGWHFNPDYSLFGTDYISRARKAPC